LISSTTHFRDVRNQFPGRLDAVHLAQVRLDVAGRHSPRVQRQDHVVEVPDTTGTLRHDNRLERTVPVTRHLDVDRPVTRRHRLRRLPVPGIPRAVAGRVAGLVPEMVRHLDLQGAFEDRFRHLVQQTVDPVDPVDRRPGRFRVLQQSVDRLGRESLGDPPRRRVVVRPERRALCHSVSLSDLPDQGRSILVHLRLTQSS
jgi:hypothetical protein